MTEITTEIEFLTGIKYAGNEYVGIVVNTDNQILTFYDADMIGSKDLKREFLELGNIWWWESNRMLPVDVFLFHEMQEFKHCVRTFILKETDIIFGPVTSMQNILKKRIKRRSIQLVRKETTKD